MEREKRSQKRKENTATKVDAVDATTASGRRCGWGRRGTAAKPRAPVEMGPWLQCFQRALSSKEGREACSQAKPWATASSAIFPHGTHSSSFPTDEEITRSRFLSLLFAGVCVPPSAILSVCLAVLPTSSACTALGCCPASHPRETTPAKLG